MTQTELVNLALSKLGASLISSLGDAEIPASHFGDLLYEPTFERVLREFPWSFATREESLAQLVTAEHQHWDYSYNLPPNFIRLTVLQSDERDIPEGNFARTGKKLHCDVAPAVLSYITSDLEPDDLDPDFREAFVTLLASELATPVLQSPQLAQALKEEYLAVALPKAKSVDARETDSKENNGPWKAIKQSPLIQSRRTLR